MNKFQIQALKAFIILLIFFQIQRFLFLTFNWSYFENFQIRDIIYAFLNGLRFDISIILLVNFLYFLILIIPNFLQKNKFFYLLTKWLFLLINSIALLLNCVDLEFFKFQGKRTTSEILGWIFDGSGLKISYLDMARDYWYILFIFLILLFSFVISYRFFIQNTNSTYFKNKQISWLFGIILLVFMVLGIRGTFERRPLSIYNAPSFPKPGLAPVVLNTTFTFLHTIQNDNLSLQFSLEDASNTLFFEREKKSKGPFKYYNVMIIILESFSAEYSELLNGDTGYTPFLDSLMKNSLYFNRAYANGTSSMNAIPSVISSIPALLPQAFITSNFAANKISSVADMLSKKGYTSIFFHGGHNGTMGFDSYVKNAGYEKYIGRNEYGNKDYDGAWGVFDEPFYLHVVEECSKIEKPFVGTVFSLSSHHPYSIPSEYINKFPKGSLAIHESIGYSDYSLGRFFEEASKTSWYDNTLFIITADHTSLSEIPRYSNKHGSFLIPMIYHMPKSNLRGVSSKITQQIDIMPSVLDFLGLEESWESFGQSVFDDTKNGFSINYNDGLFQLIYEGKLLQFNGIETVGAYDVNIDPLLKENINIEDDELLQNMDQYLKWYIYNFKMCMQTNSIIKNKNYLN